MRLIKTGRQSSAEFRACHIDALYSDPRSFVIGGIGACCAMTLLAARDKSEIILGVAVLLFICTVLRLLLTRAYRRASRFDILRHAAVWEWAYHSAATIYIFIIGSFTFSVYLGSENSMDRVLAMVTIVAYMAGIPGRNFASPGGVILQLAGGGLPMMASIVVASGSSWFLLLIVFIPYFLGLKSLADRLRKVFVDATLRAFEHEVLARRFEMALDNMPHGLMMLDEEHKTLIYNDRVRELLGLKADEDLHGRQLAEILQDVALKEDPSARISDAIDQEFVAADGRSLAFTRREKDDGGSVVVVQDVTDRRNTDKRIQELALTDSMTGLANRTHLDRFLHNHLKMAPSVPFALLFVDLDRFKQINDTFGHGQGDAVLKAVAERLMLLFSEGVVSRFGGDEFIVFHPCADLQTAEILGDRCVQSLEEPFFLDQQRFIVGASVGAAIYPDHDDKPAELIRKADAALYRAKRNGRGLVRIFSPAVDEEVRNRGEATLDLRKALENNEFEVFYQPIFDMHKNVFTSCEALVRWRHPKRGLLAPSHFIHIAEESGLIVELTKVVLQKACQDCTTWPQGTAVAINVSPACFRRGDLLSSITYALERCKLPATRLEIELTESILLENAALATAMMQMLHLSGIRISLDDFGTGYSNLSQLYHLPLHRMKIDRSFLLGLGDDIKPALMLRGLSRLGRDLGLSILIEGVESEQQLDLIRASCEVDEVQGFYFSRPQPSRETHDFLWKQVLEQTECIKSA